MTGAILILGTLGTILWASDNTLIQWGAGLGIVAWVVYPR